MCLSVLYTNPPWQVCLLRQDKAGSAKDTLGLLELCWVQELLLTVVSDKDLNLVLVPQPLE